MAFDKNFMANVGVSLTSGFVTTPWHYTLVTDTLAVIRASAYFNDFSDQLNLNDSIYITGSDGTQIIEVSAITPNVTIAVLTGPGGGGTLLAQGKFPTAGGSATEVFTLAGMVQTDTIFAQLEALGASAVTILRTTAGIGDFTVEFSADPSTDHVFQFLATRA